MNFYTNLTFKVQKGRGLRSRDPISKSWDPRYNWQTSKVNYRYITITKQVIYKAKTKSLQRRVRSTIRISHN